MKLYSCQHSRGLRASWTAAEAGVDLELEVLPFPPRAKAREFLDINPLGTVPALLVGDAADNLLMTESCAIAQFLAEKYSPGKLAVAIDEPDYPAYLDFLHHADATLTFPQTVYMRFAMFEKNLGLAAAGEAYAEWFFARLVKVENRLATRSYLCADRFTVADICIAYSLYLTKITRLHNQLSPRLQAYLAEMTARPGFATAVASHAAGAQSAA